ncbi:MAG: MOSC domain-containing protein [Rhodobacteraceae bacterium]|nr:MOSC domain-containing protein [Paracoccaceae bacterium]
MEDVRLPTGLAAMLARVAQAGRVVWIGVRPARLGAVVPVAAVEVGAAGLAGDHGRAGPRAVTLVQGEHLAAVGSYLGRGPVAPEVLRRNVVVTGINLAALKDRPLRLGGAVVVIRGVCAPCSRMEAALGPGGYAALRGHGGWCAEVLAPGPLAVGDEVVPVDGMTG